MSIYGMMQTSVSGMHAQSNRLSSVADNIANSDTNGYKRSQVLFSTLVAGTSLAGAGPGTAGNYESGSVLSHTVRMMNQQGPLEYTSSVTDLAVSGDGDFVVQDPGGQTFLTRAGSFLPDDEGRLVNQAGFYLMGYPSANGAAGATNGLADLEIVTLDGFELTTVPTTAGYVMGNLDAEAEIVAGNLPSTNAADAEFTNKVSVVAYDYLGAEVTIDVYYSKTAADTWEVTAYNKADADPTTGGFPYAAAAFATDTLTFDPTTGQLDGASPTSISIALPNGETFDLDMANFTQLAAEFGISDANINGRPPSTIDGIHVSKDGYVYGQYDDGTYRDLYRIPLGTVANPAALNAVTGTVFAQTPDSGDIMVGNPQQGGYGAIMSSAIEQSNVDIAEELTRMIQAQRGFTANSKVFQTGSDLMDVVVNLKR